MSIEKLSKNHVLAHYIINAKNACSITELMKITYLIDVGFKKITGETLTKLPFKRYFYGPFTKDLYDIVNDLLNEEFLTIHESLAVDGKSVFKITKEMSYEQFTSEEIELINQLLQELVALSATELTRISYATEPMKALKATLGGNENLHALLDFSEVKTIKSE